MLGFSKIKGRPSNARPIRFYVGIFLLKRISDRRERILLKILTKNIFAKCKAYFTFDM
jgi:hypothetical protein